MRSFSSGFVQSRRRRRGGTDHVPMQCMHICLTSCCFLPFFFVRWLGGKCLLERAWNGCIIGGGGRDRLLEVVGWRLEVRVLTVSSA
ncbi:hypothetical protein V8C43DRAFT_293691 [Trichoderma afarasin]